MRISTPIWCYLIIILLGLVLVVIPMKYPCLLIDDLSETAKNTGIGVFGSLIVSFLIDIGSTRRDNQNTIESANSLRKKIADEARTIETISKEFAKGTGRDDMEVSQALEYLFTFPACGVNPAVARFFRNRVLQHLSTIAELYRDVLMLLEPFPKEQTAIENGMNRVSSLTSEVTNFANIPMSRPKDAFLPLIASIEEKREYHEEFPPVCPDEVPQKFSACILCVLDTAKALEKTPTTSTSHSPS